MSEAPQPDRKVVPVVWVGTDDVPVHFLNQFIGQADAREVFLTLGQLVPPALLGTEETRKQQLDAIDYVPVRPIVRLGFTPERLRELIDVLQQTLEIHEQHRAQQEHDE